MQLTATASSGLQESPQACNDVEAAARVLELMERLKISQTQLVRKLGKQTVEALYAWHTSRNSRQSGVIAAGEAAIQWFEANMDTPAATAALAHDADPTRNALAKTRTPATQAPPPLASMPSTKAGTTEIVISGDELLQLDLNERSASGFLGVRKKGTKWQASYHDDGVTYEVGTYDARLEAARARRDGLEQQTRRFVKGRGYLNATLGTSMRSGGDTNGLLYDGACRPPSHSAEAAANVLRLVVRLGMSIPQLHHECSSGAVRVQLGEHSAVSLQIKPRLPDGLMASTLRFQASLQLGKRSCNGMQQIRMPPHLVL